MGQGSGTSGASGIAGARWLAKPDLQKLLRVLGTGGVARVVGGAVRNTLMGLEVSDIDIATTLLPDEVRALAEPAGFKVVPTGIDHGTVTVVAGGGRSHFEVTTLRRDVETHGRHATVAFTDDWVADAMRRDFTINAIYCDADGGLFDPVGGTEDISVGRVRFVGEPVERIREDYLRILRFFRFSARYARGALDADGLAACEQEQVGLVRLSAERVRAELLKLLAAPGAGDVVHAMSETGILGRLFGAHTEAAVGSRLIEIERACGLAADAVRRLGALGSGGGMNAEDLKTRFRLANVDTARLAALEKAPKDLDPALGERERKTALYRLGPETYRDAVLFAWARSHAAVDSKDWRDLLALPERWSAPDFPVGGHDLVERGHGTGPQVGRLLAEIEARWIESDFSLDREALLAGVDRA